MMAAQEWMPMVAAFTGLGRELLASRWSLLLIFTIAALFAGLDEGMPISQLIGWFVVCGLGLVPLARMVAEMVEALAEKLGDRIGGLISVVLGNLVELVVSFTALASGLYHLVVISVAGAVITNCLLILGVSTCLAARRKPTIDIHPYSTRPAEPTTADQHDLSGRPHGVLSAAQPEVHRRRQQLRQLRALFPDRGRAGGVVLPAVVHLSARNSP